MENSTRYEEAREQVAAMRSWSTHATIYVLVNIGLFTIDMMTSPGRVWFFFPLAGWGIGLLFHGIGVFGPLRRLDKSREERKIQALLQDQ